jgi:hypothetical protein
MEQARGTRAAAAKSVTPRARAILTRVTAQVSPLWNCRWTEAKANTAPSMPPASRFRCGVTQPTAAALQPSSAERAIRDPKIDYSF